MYNKNTNKHDGFIYLITNIKSGKKYIGQTIQMLSHRWARHKCSANRNDVLDSYIDRAIAKYGEDNFKIELIDTVSADSKDEMKKLLDDAEIFYIKKYKTMYYEGGYNLSNGGQGYKECCNKYGSKAVDCYDYISLKYLQTFSSITDAAEYYGYDLSFVAKVCKGQRAFCINKIFRYHGDELYKYPVRSKGSFPVEVFDILNNEKKTYVSCAEAAKEIGCTRTAISARLNGKFSNINPLLGKYIISYA